MHRNFCRYCRESLSISSFWLDCSRLTKASPGRQAKSSRVRLKTLSVQRVMMGNLRLSMKLGCARKAAKVAAMVSRPMSACSQRRKKISVTLFSSSSLPPLSWQLARTRSRKGGNSLQSITSRMRSYCCSSSTTSTRCRQLSYRDAFFSTYSSHRYVRQGLSQRFLPQNASICSAENSRPTYGQYLCCTRASTSFAPRPWCGSIWCPSQASMLAMRMQGSQVGRSRREFMYSQISKSVRVYDSAASRNISLWKRPSSKRNQRYFSRCSFLTALVGASRKRWYFWWRLWRKGLETMRISLRMLQHCRWATVHLGFLSRQFSMRLLTSAKASHSSSISYHQQLRTRLSQMARMLAISCSSLPNLILGSESRKVVCSCVRKKNLLASRGSIYYISTMIAFRLLQRFCGMKYYREIAEFLKIKVPILNEEIRIVEARDCVVHGIKKMQDETPLPLPMEGNSPTHPGADASVQQGPLPPAAEPLYIYEKHSQQIVPFHKAVSISKTLDMDLNLVREGSETVYPVLAVSTFRKRVYSQYFMGHIKRRGKEGFKSVRLGEKIEDNDIRTKIENIHRMMKGGERRFRLTALNDSERSEKVLIEFAKLFGKEVEPYLSSFRNAKRKLEERWVCNLIFEDEVPVSVDQVNKKWRRQQFEKEHSSRDFTPKELEQLFNNKDLKMDQEMYMAYKEMNLKMPAQFDKLARVEEELESDRLAFYRSAQSDPDEELQWDEQEELGFSEKMQRYNGQYFKERTATEIIGEMEALKASGYESEAHKVARFKQLKAELQAILRKHQHEDL